MVDESNKYKALIEVSGDGIIILEGESISDINKSALDLFKCSKEDVLGKPIEELIPEIKRRIEKALNGEPQTFELECQRRNGSSFIGEISLSGVKTKNGFSLIIIVRDVTNRKKELKRLFFISTVDPLTGAYNRRYFKGRMEEEIERAKRTGRPFSLIMFDIDKFKDINDNYGHEVGDLTLKKVARTVKDRIRKSDIFCRWGGEEFLILLPETTLDGAVKLAEDLRERISQIEIPGGERITASFGVTEYRPGDTPRDIRIRVDSLLYRSKASGRNRITAE